MMIHRWLALTLWCLLMTSTSAFQVVKTPATITTTSTTTQPTPALLVPEVQAQFQALSASVALSAMLFLSSASFAATPANASPIAAQIELDQLPPTAISVQISDLPVIGSLVSGTYSKVPDGTLKSKPSLTITSPTDKVKAIQQIATGGHLEFDIKGKINTHLDIDVATDEPGVAKIRVASKLIPKLPFKNLASSAFGVATGNKESEWNVVTNLGTGESYYYNMKTGVTQLQRPEKI